MVPDNLLAEIPLGRDLTVSLQCGRHRPDPSPLQLQQWRTSPCSLTQPPPLSCLGDSWLVQRFGTMGTHCCLGAFVQARPPVQMELWAESKVGLLGKRRVRTLERVG